MVTLAMEATTPLLSTIGNNGALVGAAVGGTVVGVIVLLVLLFLLILLVGYLLARRAKEKRCIHKAMLKKNSSYLV